MGFQHRFNVIHLLLSFVKLYSQFNIVWISQTHSSFERRYFIFPKLLNIIEAEPSEEFLKSKLLSAYLFEWFVKNSVGILSIKMYLASLQTFYVQEIFLIITGHYLKRATCKKVKSSQNKNGKPGLWSLNNFKAMKFTCITMHEYCAVHNENNSK